MSTNARTPLIRRGFVELVTVVGGILIAFALDAWWDRQVSRRWELDQLRSLREEFTENLDGLDPVVESHWSAARRLEAILAFAASSAPGTRTSFPDTILGSLIGWRTSDISLGTLDALLASGKLSEIQSAELRSRLAGWQARVDDAQEDEALARDFVEYVLTPALAGQGILAGAHAGRTGPARQLSQASNTPVTATAVLRDLVAARLTHVRLSAISIERIQDEIRQVLALLEQELDGR